MKQKIKTIAILLFSTALIACSSNSNENKNSQRNAAQTSSNDSTIVIAEINGDLPSFVADSTALRNDWQNFINTQTDVGPCELNKIEILSGADSIGSIKYYLIVSGTTQNENMKSLIELEQGGPTCWIVSGLTVSCNSKACADDLEGCVPDRLRCTPCGNKGECTKTITSDVFAIFPSLPPSTCQN